MLKKLQSLFLNSYILMNKSKELAREQLKKCFIDLAQRARELDEPYIYSVSLVLAGSIVENSDAKLALWVGEFAQMRIDEIQEYREEDDEDYEDYEDS